MGIWGDILDKSNGDKISKEEFSKIYYDNDSATEETETLENGYYRGYNYTINTNGAYPFIEIINVNEISIFSGSDIVVLKFTDDKTYELDRQRFENKVKFVYKFDKPEDYIHSNTHHNESGQDGHIYTIQELKKYTEMYIDKIIECEKDKYKFNDF